MPLSGYLKHIEQLNRWQPDRFLPFRVADERVGWIRPAFAEHLARFPDVFIVCDDVVLLNPDLSGFEQRSEVVQQVLEQMVEEGVLSHLMGERFAVVTGFGEPPLFALDRAVVSRFGVRVFGQHLNGFVRGNDGIKMWIARRARDRFAFPGRLDQLVAGGLPYGISLQANLAKECAEEADISATLAGKAIPVAQISYCYEVDQGIRDDTLFCYDLELPADFQPYCTDGEVESFELMPIEQVAGIVRSSEAFKPNCNLVVIDFLMRHGFIDRAHADCITAALF